MAVSRVLNRSAGAAAAIAALLPLAWQPAPSWARPPSSAIVQEILDGDELFIESRRARVMDRARTPQHVRTGDSRGQLRFDTGASSRLSRFTRIRLGSTCFHLGGGQILVSGPQEGCVRSFRTSVRGTNYILRLVDQEADAEVIVLEGTLEVERLVDGLPSGEPGILLQEGTRSRLSADGRVLFTKRLTAEEVAAELQGPLFRGFRSPLADGEALRRSIERNWPELGQPSPVGGPAADPEASRDPLVRSINATRVANGRPPLSPLPPELARANISYLQPVLVGIMRSNDCNHDLGRWRAIQEEMAARHPLMPTSEVIACPRPTRQWNADQIVASWLTSTHHRSILLDRPRASHIGCLRADIGDRSLAVCTIWSPVAPLT
ncbi:hypothetical protein [Cyanobium sp. NIES-981]|uniref:hypothetical protein n=1 Tax=Cyanobium sp. NIES-981 TaxID=1851505 RepID=UPI0007DD8A99|nr:hypothetical protein [Cyanobium sp. NIES-981]SBO42790.1 FecR protein [Cyanobium sp. NIES-981]